MTRQTLRSKSRCLRAGHTLGAVMLMVAICSILLFAAAQRSIMNVRMVQQRNNRQLAQNLGETLIARCLSEVLRNRSANVFANLSNEEGYPEGSGATVYCANNLQGKNAIAGYAGRSIPRNVIQLVSTARVGDVELKTEVFYYIPPFPKALMSSGKIKVTRSLKVSGLDPEVSYPQPGAADAISPEQRHAASLCSNSESQDPNSPAIFLGAGSSVTGDVQAAGKVQLAGNVTVDGEVLADQAAQPITDLDIVALLAQAKNAAGGISVPNDSGPLTVNFYSGVSGSLNIHGDLTLENDGVLWVDGDLNVEGGVKGRGLVLVNGNMTMRGGADLSAQNLIALAATGDVKLEASDKNRYFFQGLVYTKSSLSAKEITVMGTVMVNGPPGRGDMNLEDVNLISAPVAGLQDFGFSKRHTGLKMKLLNDQNDPNDWEKDDGSHPVVIIAFRPVPGSTDHFDMVYTDDQPSYNKGKSYIFRNRTLKECRDLTTKPPKAFKELTQEEAKGVGWIKPMTPDEGSDFNPLHTAGAGKIATDVSASPPPMSEHLNLDLISRMLSDGDRARILLWRVL